jgi:hypothetical protein
VNVKNVYITQINIEDKTIKRVVDTISDRIIYNAGELSILCNRQDDNGFDMKEYMIHAESEVSADQADYLAICCLIEMISKLSDVHKVLGFQGNKLVIK